MLGIFSKLGIFGTKKLERPEGLTDKVMIGDREGEIIINHTGSAQAGFRDINLCWPETFAEVMEQNGLNPEEMYRIKTGNLGDYLYLWANEELMLLMETNPLTDEPDSAELAGMKTGGGGHYVAIEGRQKAVQSLYEDMEEAAFSIYGKNPEEREFL